nr:hypothetical protein CFP56_30731 [Quercus suber]
MVEAHSQSDVIPSWLQVAKTWPSQAARQRAFCQQTRRADVFCSIVFSRMTKSITKIDRYYRQGACHDKISRKGIQHIRRALSSVESSHVEQLESVTQIQDTFREPQVVLSRSHVKSPSQQTSNTAVGVNVAPHRCTFKNSPPPTCSVFFDTFFSPSPPASPHLPHISHNFAALVVIQEQHTITTSTPNMPQRHNNNEDDGSVFSDDGYEHWPSDHPYLKQPAVPAPGYDSHNGLGGHLYVPPSAVAAPHVPRPVVLPPVQPAHSYRSTDERFYRTGMRYSPNQPQYHPGQYAQPLWYAPEPDRAYSRPQHFTPPPPDLPEHELVSVETWAGGPRIKAPVAWFGRTRAEVEADNMRIAAEEQAYEKRTMVPSDMADDQKCWVIELDESQTIREYREIKEMEGEWKEDPRSKGARFFVRAAGKGTKKEAEPQFIALQIHESVEAFSSSLKSLSNRGYVHASVYTNSDTVPVTSSPANHHPSQNPPPKMPSAFP